MDTLQQIKQSMHHLCSLALLCDAVPLRRRLKKAKTSEEMQTLQPLIQQAANRAQSRWNKKPNIIYPDLPIIQKKDDIIHALQENNALIVAASTGSGKSTQLAKFCLDAGLGRRGKIVCVQPRRIAAISLASHIAAELGQEIGQAVDYHIRFEDKTVPDSFIRLMTDGMLLAQMQKDPSLWEYEAIIIDEVHERSLNIDLLLGLLYELRKKRPALRIIIASATLEAQKFCDMWQAPLFYIETSLFPIQIHYRAPTADEDVLLLTRSILQEVLDTTYQGDILIFMPTEEDIHQTIALCKNVQSKQNIEFLPLYARLPGGSQQKVFGQSQARKVIVSTNIAETSLTIEGIVYVIDTGLARIAQYSGVTHLQSLPIMPISRSSANQRKGRCGRTAPGVCYRLYSEEDFNTRDEFTCPEIQRSNLSDAVLRMLSLGISDLENFPFPDPPQKRYFHAALINLHELGALTSIEQPKLTRIGKTLAHLPIDARLGRILLAATEEGCLKEILIITAGLASQEICERPKEALHQAQQKHELFRQTGSDFLFFLNLYQAVMPLMQQSARKVRNFCKDHFLSYARLREWLSLAQQLGILMKDKGYRHNSIGSRGLTATLKPLKFEEGYAAIHRCILYGYVRNTAHLTEIPAKNKQDKPMQVYQNLQRKNLNIVRGSAVYKDKFPWMISAVIIHTHQLTARMNAAVDQEWIIQVARPLLRYKAEFPVFSEKKSESVCQLRGYWGQFLLDPGKETALINHDPALAKELFIRATLAAEEPDEHRMKAYIFWQKNEDLRQKIQNIQHRLRKNTFYAGNQALFNFYMDKLPHLASWMALDKYIKEHGDAQLFCQESDLLAQTPEDDIENFPEKISLNQQKFPISYAFEPGKEYDGFTICLHADEIESLDADQAAWGIGGNFAQRIEEIIRNLPKPQRIKLHPIKESCNTLVKNIVREGNFFLALQKFCYQHWQIFISEEDWRCAEEKISPYLRVRYALMDHKGQQVAASRNLQDLKQIDLPAMPSGSLDVMRQKYEQHPFTHWPHFSLIQALAIEKNGKKIGVCYPALQEKKGQVYLCLFQSKTQAETTHRAACRILLHQQFSKEILGLKRSLASSPASIYFSYFGGAQHFDELFWQGVLHRHFSPMPQSEEDWQAYNPEWMQNTAKTVHKEKEFALECLDLYARQHRDLDTWKQKYPHLKNFWQKQKNILDECAGANVWPTMSCENLDFLSIYLKSLSLRCQRALSNPAKDREKERTIEHFAARIASLKDQPAYPAAFLMYQQLQIKTFTPELLANIKTSAQSLENFLCEHS